MEQILKDQGVDGKWLLNSDEFTGARGADEACSSGNDDDGDMTPQQLMAARLSCQEEKVPLPRGVGDVGWVPPRLSGLDNSSPILELSRDSTGHITDTSISRNEDHFRSWQEDNEVDKIVDGNPMKMRVPVESETIPADESSTPSVLERDTIDLLDCKGLASVVPAIEYATVKVCCGVSPTFVDVPTSSGNAHRHQNGVHLLPLSPSIQPIACIGESASRSESNGILEGKKQRMSCNLEAPQALFVIGEQGPVAQPCAGKPRRPSTSPARYRGLTPHAGRKLLSKASDGHDETFVNAASSGTSEKGNAGDATPNNDFPRMIPAADSNQANQIAQEDPSCALVSKCNGAATTSKDKGGVDAEVIRAGEVYSQKEEEGSGTQSPVAKETKQRQKMENEEKTMCSRRRYPKGDANTELPPISSPAAGAEGAPTSKGRSLWLIWMCRGQSGSS